MLYGTDNIALNFMCKKFIKEFLDKIYVKI